MANGHPVDKQDRTRIVAEIAARLRIRLDEDDPAFVMVELNRLILRQTIAELLRDIHDSRETLSVAVSAARRPPFAILALVLMAGAGLVLLGSWLGLELEILFLPSRSR